MALLSDGGIISRFVLNGDFLEPDSIHFLDSFIRGKKIFLEIRNGGTHQLPIEIIRALSGHCGYLIIDAFTTDHRVVMDCLLLGADEVCIESTTSSDEIQMLHATTDKSLIKVNVDNWPPINSSVDDHHQDLLRIAAIAGRNAVVTTKSNGVLKKWWDDLPENIANDFDWHFAPSEGKIVQLDRDFLISAWLI